METTSKTFWQTACELKIGPVPAPVYLVLAVIVAAATIFGQLPADMVGGIAIMMVMGILLGDIGLKVPILKDIGGPAILSIFIPSAMVYYGLLNSDAIKAITAFTKGANFLYFYISCLVVGSILGMVRTVLVQGFLRMFVPLVVGTVVASILGCIAGMLCGEDLYHTFFFIVIPILSGGVGEGILPLAAAYSEILNQSADQFLVHFVPAAMLGNLFAIMSAGYLKKMGERFRSVPRALRARCDARQPLRHHVRGLPQEDGRALPEALGQRHPCKVGRPLRHYERQGRRSPARRQDDGRGPRPRLLLLLCGQGARPLDSDPRADSDDHPCRAHQGP